ncbi:hypothetical protein B0J13DRAFT_528040 [Dactylonectria estremocensis]|uniref:Zn(2)-C6 fungal-type domain-containing protein n=1 Tax=Dactylonectria estremocensis TaxID=1079267 RepID=A0A9P9EHX9_9HYPO|nr:hypothetical protein B0J13DRAFT_528040 [Dactylonectria estremocensis]
MSITFDSLSPTSPAGYDTTSEPAKSDDGSIPIQPIVSQRRQRSDYPACQTCRKRKVRCIQGTPGEQCVNCLLFGDECVIPTGKRRFKPKTRLSINPNVRSGSILRRLVKRPRIGGGPWKNQQPRPLASLPTPESSQECSCEADCGFYRSKCHDDVMIGAKDGLTSGLSSDIESTDTQEIYRRPSETVQSAHRDHIRLLSLLEAWDDIGTLNIA